jgi:hypothetical protein
MNFSLIDFHCIRCKVSNDENVELWIDGHRRSWYSSGGLRNTRGAHRIADIPARIQNGISGTKIQIDKACTYRKGHARSVKTKMKLVMGNIVTCRPVVRRRLGKHIPVTRNTQATIG